MSAKLWRCWELKARCLPSGSSWLSEGMDMYTDGAWPHNRTSGGMYTGFQLLFKFCSLTVHLTPGQSHRQEQTTQLFEGLWNLPRFVLWVVSEVTYYNTPGLDLHCGFQKQVLRENERTREPGIDFKTLQRKGQTPSASFRRVGWAGLAVMGQGKGTLSLAQVASLWQKRHVLLLSPRLPFHNHSSSPHRQPWRRSSIANAIQQIHFINFNYIPTENEWSENIKHLPSRSFTFFIQ